MKKAITLFSAAVVAFTIGLIATAEAKAQEPPVPTVTVNIDDIEFSYGYATNDRRAINTISVPVSMWLWVLYDMQYPGGFIRTDVTPLYATYQNIADAMDRFRQQSVTVSMYYAPQPAKLLNAPYGFIHFNDVRAQDVFLPNENINRRYLRDWEVTLNWAAAEVISVNHTLSITTGFKPVLSRIDYRPQYKARLFGEHYGNNDHYEGLLGALRTADECWENMRAKQDDIIRLQSYQQSPNAHNKCFAGRISARVKWLSVMEWEHTHKLLANCVTDSLGRGVIKTPFMQTMNLVNALRDKVMHKVVSASGDFVYKYRLNATQTRYSRETVNTICAHFEATDYEGVLPTTLTANDVFSQLGI